MDNLNTPHLVRAGAIKFSCLERGRGAPLVLLHGIGSGSRSWSHQLGDFSDAFRVIAWDAPGYGESTPLDAQAPDASDYALRLASLLDALDVERCHLVGHSLGTVMAARFAAEHPQRLLSLTLASVSTGHARLPEEERARLRAGRIDDVRALGPRGMAEKRGARLLSSNASDELKRTVIDNMATVRPDGYCQAVRMLSSADTRADAARLPTDLPVCVLYGDEDVITPPESNRLVAAECPHAAVHVIAGAGHAVYLEKRLEFNSVVSRFIAGATP
jgi:pimeloyl-ACP methyl ester carboxylesterase